MANQICLNVVEANTIAVGQNVEIAAGLFGFYRKSVERSITQMLKKRED